MAKKKTIKINKLRKAVAVALNTNVMNVGREDMRMFYRKAA